MPTREIKISTVPNGRVSVLFVLDGDIRYEAQSVSPPDVTTQVAWLRDEKLPKEAERICYRTACRKPGAIYWNSSTRQYYCPTCARKINEHNPGLCVLMP